MKRSTAIVVVGLAIVLAGCKTNLTADIYSSDLRDTVAGTAGLTAPATMAFQVPGTDDCPKHTAEISEVMTGIMPFEPRGCESVEMESYLLADIQVPILDSESTWKGSDALFGLIARKLEGSEDVGVAVIMNREKYDLLATRTHEKFHQRINLAESKVTLILNNDERTPLHFRARDVFVNTEPVHGEREYELTRRHKVEIRLSNVATAYLAKSGRAAGFVLAGDPS